MKKILAIAQEFLRKYPAPTQISRKGDIFKLIYTFSSPYTDSKQTKQVFLPYKNIASQQLLQSTTKKLIYNQKGRIEESQSFDSTLVKDKHEKMLQDDCFGKASHTPDYSRWVYIAEVKQEPVKSYFNEGKGKLPFKYDFGESYEGIKQAGIFVWEKTTKKVHRVEIDKNLIPAYVSFANSQGSQIVFHAYKRQKFGHGILHCLNRPVSIYHAKLKFPIKESEKQEKEKKQTKIESEITQLIKDHHQTNMFPKMSPCFNYLVYTSGTGITHTFYLDLVVTKRAQGQWKEVNRIKEKVVGFYDILSNYIVQKDGQTYAIFQTVENSTTQIYKLDLDTGELLNLTKSFSHYDFTVEEVQPDGMILGNVTTNNYNTLFYSQKDQIMLIQPPHKQEFVIKEYEAPIPAVLISAQEKDIYEEYKHRAAQRPLLVVLHGGPHASFSPALTCFRYTLLKMGYALLFPNIPGSISYGPEYLKANLGGLGEKDVKPLLQLLSLVLSEDSKIDKTKVHAYGGSYGGYLTALLGSRHSSLFRSAIILNGVLSLAGQLWFTDIPEWVTAETLGKQQLHSLTKDDYVQMWNQSSAREPMKVPTLQLLGAKDLRVPYRQGLFFDAITKQAGTPITTYVYQNSNHGLADSVETSMDVIIKSILFLQQIKEEQAENK